MRMCSSQQRIVFATLCSAIGTSAGIFPDILPRQWYPLDPEVGDVEQVTAEVLSGRFRGKSALIVGGTDGIGRGTAIAMAQAGASVVVVGHNPTKAQAVLSNMSAVAKFPKEQQFKAYCVDLFTVEGGLTLSRQLTGNKTRFDYVVLSVGMWPDWKDPKTADGLDKVISLDVISRYLVTREILPLLNPGARVMSTLISGWRLIFWKDLASLPATRMKDIALGKVEGHYSLPEMLGTAGTIGDTWLELMSHFHPEVGFIGTFPGVVATDLLDHGFVPKWAIPYVNQMLKGAGLDPVDCGILHATIISSPNAVRRPATYFSVDQKGVSRSNLSSVSLEGRLTNPLAYNADFGQWVWSFLEDTIANHTSAAAKVNMLAGGGLNPSDALIV